MLRRFDDFCYFFHQDPGLSRFVPEEDMIGEYFHFLFYIQAVFIMLTDVPLIVTMISPPEIAGIKNISSDGKNQKVNRQKKTATNVKEQRKGQGTKRQKDSPSASFLLYAGSLRSRIKLISQEVRGFEIKS